MGTFITYKGSDVTLELDSIAPLPFLLLPSRKQHSVCILATSRRIRLCQLQACSRDLCMHVEVKTASAEYLRIVSPTRQTQDDVNLDLQSTPGRKYTPT